jgi:hypothetical protein
VRGYTPEPGWQIQRVFFFQPLPVTRGIGDRSSIETRQAAERFLFGSASDWPGSSPLVRFDPRKTQMVPCHQHRNFDT